MRDVHRVQIESAPISGYEIDHNQAYSNRHVHARSN